MSVVNPNIRFTYDDYKSLPESMNKRYELLDGDITMVPAPTTGHQRVTWNLGFLLKSFVRGRRLGLLIGSPVDVVFGEGKNREVVQPDLIFISHERKHIVAEEEVRGAPDLVIEVLSSGTEERDRGYKKSLYLRYGVREYWIVDPKAETIEMFLPVAGGFQQKGPYQAIIPGTSRLFPDLQLDFEDVFRAE